MHRDSIMGLLMQYLPYNTEEKVFHQRTMDFIKNNKDCFERSHLEGHITASAFIVNSNMTETVLIHHRKLDRWFQPGGHCDGDSDVAFVAMKEAFEETALTIASVGNYIFDIDVHLIPEYKGVAEHFHYDIRFLFLSNDKIKQDSSEEIKKVEWVNLADIEDYTKSNSILRMRDKIAAAMR